MESPLLRGLFKPQQPAWPKPEVPKPRPELPPAIVLHTFDSDTELEDVHKVCDRYGSVRMIHILVEEVPAECPQQGVKRTKTQAVVYVYYSVWAEANTAMAGLRKQWPDSKAVRWDSLFRRR